MNESANVSVWRDRRIRLLLLRWLGLALDVQRGCQRVKRMTGILSAVGGDIAWLPCHVQINAKGQLLAKQYLTSETHQFFTISGDGYVLFWDIRFEDIMMGKIPHIAKVKGMKQPQHQQQ